jgi:hypothetical protein
MPAEAGMGWRYIPEAWAVNGSTMSFVHTYEEDEVKVAMRVPFTLSDEAALMAEARRAKAAGVGVEVAEVGKSVEGRALHVVKVSSGGDEGERTHTCILMYAREHADEPDSSWAVTGALRRLLADDTVAQELRSHCTFLFIPIFDLDSAAISRHEGFLTGFNSTTSTPESNAYGKFFHTWMQKGKRLDVVYDFHNVESNEGDHFLPPLFPPSSSPFRGPAVALHNANRQHIQSHGYQVRVDSWSSGTSRSRLFNWVSDIYGSLPLSYELNSQFPGRHLAMLETENLGAMLVQSTPKFLDNEGGQSLQRLSKQMRDDYILRWQKYGDAIEANNVFGAEAECFERQRKTGGVLGNLGQDR